MALEKCKPWAKKCDSLVSKALVDFRRNLKSAKMSVRKTNLPEPTGVKRVHRALVFCCRPWMLAGAGAGGQCSLGMAPGNTTSKVRNPGTISGLRLPNKNVWRKKEAFALEMLKFFLTLAYLLLKSVCALPLLFPAAAVACPWFLQASAPFSGHRDAPHSYSCNFGRAHCRMSSHFFSGFCFLPNSIWVSSSVPLEFSVSVFGSVHFLARSACIISQDLKEIRIDL